MVKNLMADKSSQVNSEDDNQLGKSDIKVHNTSPSNALADFNIAPLTSINVIPLAYTINNIIN
jgi:hypothetical protein